MARTKEERATHSCSDNMCCKSLTAAAYKMLLLGINPWDNNGLPLTLSHVWCVTVILINTASVSSVVWDQER